MKKIYLSLLAIMIAVGVNAQNYIWSTNQYAGTTGMYKTYNFQAYISDSTLLSNMTFQWLIEGANYTGQNISHTFSTAGTHIIHLSATGQGLSFHFIDTLIFGGRPCQGIYDYNYTINTSDIYTPDGEVHMGLYGENPPYTYNWSCLNDPQFHSTNSHIDSLRHGWYAVEYQDSNLCTDSLFVFVGTDSLPSSCNLNVTANIQNASYAGALNGSIDITVNTNMSNYEFYWMKAGDFISTSASSLTEDLLQIDSGYYTLIIIDTSSPHICFTKINYNVGIDSLTHSCRMGLYGTVTDETLLGANDGNITLSVFNGFSPLNFAWYHDTRYVSNSWDLNNIGSGYYIVLVTDSNNCFAYQTFIVNTNSPIIPCNLQSTYTLTYPTAVTTQDGAIDISMYNANPPLYYYWTDGINNYYTEDLNQIDSGTYTVSVVDQDSCTYTETFYLYPDSLSTIATYSYYIDTCLNQIASASIISYSVNANNEITVVWEFVEAGTGNTSTITVTYLSNTAFLNGRYQFVLSINCNGAKSTVTDTYSDYLDVVTAIDEYSNNNLYKIYPNPAKETISISLTSSTNENSDIYMYNSIGMLVYKEEIEINSGINTYQIPIINLQNGIYFIKINEKVQNFIKN